MEALREAPAVNQATLDNIVTLDRPRGEGKIEARPAPVPEAKSTPLALPPPAPVVAPARKRSKARFIVPVLLLAALGGGGWYGYNWWTDGRFMVSTDDAYIQADVATLGTKVAGYVATVSVRDGDQVKAGDILATLDETDFQLARDSALAKRATQSATIDRIAQQVIWQGAQIDSARAGVDSAKAEVTRTAAAFDRAKALSLQNFSTKASLDQAVADRDRATASLANANAALEAAQANLGVIKAQKVEAEQVAKELDATIAKAESDLAATIIHAPADGVIGNRAIQPGQYVSPGSRLMALVPMRSVYVAANFKETQLGSLRPGQKVSIEVDSLSGRRIEGIVGNISPASGSTFSLLPPENATGNFTKITQRITVRIDVPAAIAAERVLRPGLSVVVSADTRTGPQV